MDSCSIKIRSGIVGSGIGFLRNCGRIEEQEWVKVIFAANAAKSTAAPTAKAVPHQKTKKMKKNSGADH